MDDAKTLVFDSSPKTDTASLMAMMNNNSWNNNPFMYLIWLAFFGNGGFGWNRGAAVQGAEVQGLIAQLQSTVNDNHNNDLAMQAIQGNGAALHELANNLNINSNALTAAIGNVSTMVGMSGKDIVNGILLGNKDLMQLISTCCCENKQLVTSMGYETQLRDLANTATITSRIDQLSNGVQEGFASTAYATQAQTNAIQNSLSSQTLTIIDKINSLEANAQLDKINSLTAQLTAANSRAERQAELAPIYQQLNSIKASQPSTVAVPYPQLTAVPSYYLNGYGYNTGAWA